MGIVLHFTLFYIIVLVRTIGGHFPPLFPILAPLFNSFPGIWPQHFIAPRCIMNMRARNIEQPASSCYQPHLQGRQTASAWTSQVYLKLQVVSPTLNTRIKLTHCQNSESRKTDVKGEGGKENEVKRCAPHVSHASHDAIFGNRRASTRSKARLGKVEEEGKSLEANSQRDLSGPLLYLPWLCPP